MRACSIHKYIHIYTQVGSAIHHESARCRLLWATSPPPVSCVSGISREMLLCGMISIACAVQNENREITRRCPNLRLGRRVRHPSVTMHSGRYRSTCCSPECSHTLVCAVSSIRLMAEWQSTWPLATTILELALTCPARQPG